MQLVIFCLNQNYEQKVWTTDRLFMCLVGPSGSSKTQFLYDLIEHKAFEPMYESIIYFYQIYQSLYDEIRYIVSTIEFIQGVNFDLVCEFVKENIPKKAKQEGFRFLMICRRKF